MTSNRSGPLTVVAAAMALVLVACGAEPTATPTSVPTAVPLPQATPTPTPDEAALFQAEWDALIKAAQAEGKLVMAGGGSSFDIRKFYEYFGDQFGITPVLSSGSGREQANRILAEQGAGRYEVDIVHSGLTTIKARLGPRALEYFPPWLFHPEVIDESLWFEGKHKYIDPENKTGFAYTGRVAVATTEGAGMGLWYNTNLVTQEEIEAIESPWDLLQDKWKGEFVSQEVTQGGGGLGQLVNAWRSPNMGEEWLRAYWIGMEPFITNDSRLIESTLVNGRFHWGYSTGLNAEFRDLRRLGAPVSNQFPKRLVFFDELQGGSTRGQFAIAKNPPNPNATKLYVNWFLSREGQTYMQSRLRTESRPERGAMVSLREDVEPGLTLPEMRRQPGGTYVWEPDYNPELDDLRFQMSDWLADLLGRERLRARN